MMRTNPMLLIDFYKAVHAEMLPRGINKSVSYETARMSRIKRWNEIVSFIWQPICKTYLVDYFNENFFNRPFDEVISEYAYDCSNDQLGLINMIPITQYLIKKGVI